MTNNMVELTENSLNQKVLLFCYRLISFLFRFTNFKRTPAKQTFKVH